jgi:N-methylhydantoinase A
MIDIVSVGTGGGSIAWAGPDGGLRVGPRSAGAVPGPLAYGRGGEQPTVTDAALVLGLLPEELAGGTVRLRTDLAEEGLDRLAARLGLTRRRLAEGILELSAHNQANAVTQLTVKRGVDPSGDALVAFGGAGPLQAARIAEILGLAIVVIPPSPGNVSAFGLLAVDLKDDYVTTLVQRHDAVDRSAVETLFGRLEEAARASLTEQGVVPERVALVRSVEARYLGEAHELSLPVAGDFAPVAATAAFHDAHERAYGYAYRTGEVVEFVNWKVTGLGLIDRPRLEPQPASGRATGAPTSRGGYAVYRRESLATGFRGEGPAIVDEYGSTTVIERGFRFEVDGFGNLVLRR